jgi:predicted nucleic acid-binding protein
MSRAITVKVATPKVIKALETKLASLKKDYENQATNEAKFQKAFEKYQKALIAYAIENYSKATNLRANHANWKNTVNVDFDVPVTDETPKAPERDFTTMAEYQYKEATEEISNALSILKMTDEEYVNASTMKSIAKYL